MLERKRRGRDLFRLVQPMLSILVGICKLLPLDFRKFLYDFFRMVNGYKGLGIRYVLFKSIAKSCGSNVAIHPCVWFFHIDRINVGSNVTFHPNCYIDGSGGVTVGSDVSIAHGVSIMSSSHNNEDLTIPVADQGLEFKSTIIEDNVWIGAKATILYGHRIGTGSIVGAHSLITKDVDTYTVVGGVPARVLRRREDKRETKNA